ncbi:MAG: lipid-A-disaccharide synthase [Pseudomonadales bacterium]|nr:lipid-A-disaccharide synthase [Pseudomonadales bacterium]
MVSESSDQSTSSLIHGSKNDTGKNTLIAIVAGEVSGDMLGAGLIRQIKKTLPDARFVGIGGTQMIAQGFESFYPMDRLSVMGIVEVLGRLRELLKIRKDLGETLISQRPDVFVGIDAPDFTLDLEKNLHQAGISTVHYVSPSVWAWRQWRVKKIKKAVDLMLTLLPFENQFYKKHSVPVAFVGHPLADEVPTSIDCTQAKKQFGFQPDDKVVAVLPGSRGGEVRYIGPLFIEVMQWLIRQRSDLKFIVPLANDARRQQFETLLREANAENLPITLVDGQSREVMAASDVVLLASGTATLEALLLKKPMVVAYKWGKITHAIIAPLVRTKFVSLPNLLAGEALVPEYLQEQATVEQVGPAVLTRLDPEAKTLLEKRFGDIHLQLRQKADQKAANAVLGLLGNK